MSETSKTFLSSHTIELRVPRERIYRINGQIGIIIKINTL